MSPEHRNEQLKPAAANVAGQPPEDLELVRSEVNGFFAENYDSDRNPAHSERVVDILGDFGHETEGLKTAALLHDVIDHGIVNPQNDQLKKKSRELIGDLYEQVEDKNKFLYAIGCGISASNWESEVAEAWRTSAVNEVMPSQESGDTDDINSAILLGAITKNKTILDSWTTETVTAVLQSNELFDLDTEKLREAMTKLDVEGLIIKAAEIMDNLEYPPPDNPASTWRDCTEVFNCYGPALDLFGFKDLASELRGKALEFYYDDPDGNALHQRRLAEKYFDDVYGQLQTGITYSGHSEEEFSAYSIRIKSEGALRKKLHSEGYRHLDMVPDGIGAKIVVPDIDEKAMEALARNVQAAILNSSEDVEDGHPRGDIPFEVRKKEESDYSAIHVTFIYKTPDGDVPYELQFVTEKQEEIHEVGNASHILFKLGITDPEERIKTDLQHMRARAHFLQSQVVKPELNPNTWAQIVKYLPDLDTPFHQAFTLNSSAGDKTVLTPPRLSQLDLSELADDIKTESELDAIFLPPDKLEVDHFFELISFIDPSLCHDPKIIKAVELLQSLDLKLRKDGEPTLEGHLLPTAVNAAILATISGKHLESEEFPSESLSETITAALLHDVIEDTRKSQHQKITKKEISRMFGKNIGKTVSDLTSPGQIKNERRRRRKYAVQVASNKKALLIKLSDRMQNHQTDLVRLNEGVDQEIEESIFDYFKKTDEYLTDEFNKLPEEYRRVRDMIWGIAKHFGHEMDA